MKFQSPALIAVVFLFAIGFNSISAQESEDEIKVLYGVASEFDENGMGYDIEYSLSVDLEPDVIIDPDSKTLTLNIAGEIVGEDEWLVIMLPEEIISLPHKVLVDGIHETDAILLNEEENINTLYVPLKPGSKEISMSGVAVIPEFGSVAALILVISITSIIIFTSTKKVSIFALR